MEGTKANDMALFATVARWHFRRLSATGRLFSDWMAFYETPGS